jgi:hypothetical protein
MRNGGYEGGRRFIGTHAHLDERNDEYSSVTDRLIQQTMHRLMDAILDR